MTYPFLISVFIIIVIGTTVPVFNLTLALSGIGVFVFEFLKIAVIFFHHSIVINDFRMTAQVVVEGEGLTIMKGQAVSVERVAACGR